MCRTTYVLVASNQAVSMEVVSRFFGQVRLECLVVKTWLWTKWHVFLAANLLLLWNNFSVLYGKKFWLCEGCGSAPLHPSPANVKSFNMQSFSVDWQWYITSPSNWCNSSMELDIAVVGAKLEHCSTEERDTAKTPAVDLFFWMGAPPRNHPYTLSTHECMNNHCVQLTIFR